MRRPGFVIIMAIVLIGIVGITLAVLGAAFVQQARRTQMLSQDAQLRQLLLAGTQVMQARLQRSLAGDAPIDLPQALVDEHASLIIHTLSSSSEDDREVEIEAALPRHKMIQHVRFQMRNGCWEVVSADLGL